MMRLSLLVLFPAMAAADPPRVVDATMQEQGGRWTVSVTLSHPDAGWDHYADGWRVLDNEGNELGMRTLFHPHVDEQPFTRSLTGVSVPPDLPEVFVEPRCNVDGWSGERIRLAVPGR